MLYNKGFTGTESWFPRLQWRPTALVFRKIYAFMGQFPNLREWVGDRVLGGLTLYDYTIKNLRFESTLNIPRMKLEDDSYGIFAPMAEQMGRVAKQHPDRILFGMLLNGFTLPCYDGQPFFSTAHPSFDKNGLPIEVSNVLLENPNQGAPGVPWFLFDTKQPVKPLVEREFPTRLQRS